MKQKIIDYLNNIGYPERARYIARALGVERRTINQILYSNINAPFVRNDDFEWSIGSFIQVKAKKNQWAIDALNREIKELVAYLVSIYEQDPDLFDLADVNYHMSDKVKQLTAECELFLIHMIIDHQFYDRSEQYDEDDVLEVLQMLKPSLSFDYSTHRHSIDILKNRFETLSAFSRQMLMSVIRYDDKYEYRKAPIIVQKINSLSFSTYFANDSDQNMRQKVEEYEGELKAFIAENYDYSRGLVDSFTRCDDCNKWIKEENACDVDDGLVCYECADLREREESVVEEGLFTSNDDNEAEHDDEKTEIVEDCTTCYFGARGTCKDAYKNVVCDEYEYKVR